MPKELKLGVAEELAVRRDHEVSLDMNRTPPTIKNIIKTLIAVITVCKRPPKATFKQFSPEKKIIKIKANPFAPPNDSRGNKGWAKVAAPTA